MYSFVSVSAYFFLQRFFFVRLSRTTLQCDRFESYAMQQSFGSLWIIQSTVWLRQDGDLAGVFFCPLDGSKYHTINFRETFPAC